MWLKVQDKDVSGALDYLRSGILPNKNAFLGHIARYVFCIGLFFISAFLFICLFVARLFVFCLAAGAYFHFLVT